MYISNIFENELSGKWTLLSTKECAEEVDMILDDRSIRNLLDILNTKRLTKDNQRLFARELWAKKKYENIITKYQSPWVQHGNTFSYSTQQRPSAHFSMELKGATSDTHGDLGVVSIKLSNVIVSFNDFQPTSDGDDLYYVNVELMVVSDNNTVSLLTENDN